MQQLCFLREKFDESDKDPFKHYKEDLKALIESKLEILMGDFNISMTTKNQSTTMLQDLGMKEAISDKYATKTNKPSTTFQGETTVLDGLWITDNVESHGFIYTLLVLDLLMMWILSKEQFHTKPLALL